MIDRDENHPRARPGVVEHAQSALNGWFGDYLSHTENGLQQAMAFYRDNQPIAPENIEAPPSGTVCILVHGLGCNEALWNFPAPNEGDSYGELLHTRLGYLPLYLRFNTGLHISDNGGQFASLLGRYCDHHGAAIKELLLIGHSMGGLVLRSACHIANETAQNWVARVQHVVYLGSPHLGAPLEKATNIMTRMMGFFDTTATRVIRDVLNTRSAGIKDLRFGNLVDQDWLNYDSDELLKNRRVHIPWLVSARHLRVVGHALPGVGALGDAMVRPESASGGANTWQTGAPEASDVQVMPGLDHVTLAHHPAVFECIERWLALATKPGEKCGLVNGAKCGLGGTNHE